MLDDIRFRAASLSSRLLGGGASESRAATSLFTRTRLRMTLWYAGLLATALLLFSVILYVGVRNALIGPVQQSLQNNARLMASSWDPASPLGPCDAAFRLLGPQPWACYDSHGNLIQASRVDESYPMLTNSALAGRALSDGSASSTVSVRGAGAIERYTQRVQVGSDILGVVEVDTPVQAELDALDGLVRLLIVVSILILIAAFIGGLFLGSRALLPLRLAYRRQREFVADAAHEFRTPLTLLRADAETLLRSRDHLPPNDASLVEDMVAETTHMGALSNRLLDLARLDAGIAGGEADVIDLAELARNLATRATPLAADREVTIDTQTEEPVLVIGDTVLLEEAVLILIDNAIKYNRPGGIVTVRVDAQGVNAVLSVRDTGVGIKAEDVARLGERFFRVDKARSRSMGGAGLGLSIARRIARQLGGTLQLSSEPEVGTLATLSLPSAQAVERPIPAGA